VSGKTLLLFSGAPQEPTVAREPEERGPPRVCPACAQQFSGGDTRFCPFDGESLVESSHDVKKDPLLGLVVDERYEIVEVLGEGGMGTVYRVRHRTLERALALKALRRDLASDKDLPQRFIQEAKAAAAVDHPNVVQITDFGTLDTGQPYFVMELLEGEPLSRVMSDGTLAVDRVIKIAMQVAEALAAAHEAGVVHRDLKPDNVQVRRVGHTDVVKVLDFGLAKIAGASRLTRAGIVYGTPHYMSPEQASGDPSDHRVDIYALGVVMYEMLTSHLPFEADSFTGVLAKHMYMEAQLPSSLRPDIRPGIDAIVMRCLAKQPAERYATMGDLLLDLKNEQQHPSLMPTADGVPSEEVPLAFSSSRRPQRWQIVGGALGLTAVAFGLTAWILSRPEPEREPEPAQPIASPTVPARTAIPIPPASRAMVPTPSEDPPPKPVTTGVSGPKAKRPVVVQTTASGGTRVPQKPPKKPAAGEIINPWGSE
jgi:serine/threonine protein kinase